MFCCTFFETWFLSLLVSSTSPTINKSIEVHGKYIQLNIYGITPRSGKLKTDMHGHDGSQNYDPWYASLMLCVKVASSMRYLETESSAFDSKYMILSAIMIFMYLDVLRWHEYGVTLSYPHRESWKICLTGARKLCKASTMLFHLSTQHQLDTQKYKCISICSG